jgi:hypothetical protein
VGPNPFLVSGSFSSPVSFGSRAKPAIMSSSSVILLALSPMSYGLVEKLVPTSLEALQRALTSLEALQHALTSLEAFQHALIYSIVISPANNGLLVYLAPVLLNSPQSAPMST